MSVRMFEVTHFRQEGPALSALLVIFTFMLQNMRRFRETRVVVVERGISGLAKSRLDKPRRGVQTGIDKRNVGVLSTL